MDREQTRARALHCLDRIGSPVAVVGSLNADLTVRTPHHPAPGETVAGSPLVTLPGGKSANQAVAARLLGAPTAMVGLVGDDEHGELLLSSLRDAGVEVDAVERRAVHTGTAMITVADTGENTIVVSPGANGEVDAAFVDAHAAALQGAGALGLCLEIGDDAVAAAIRQGRAAGAQVVLNLSPFRASATPLTADVDVLLVNQHELAQACGYAPDLGDPEALGQALAGLGARRAVVTLGGDGSVVWDDGKATAVAAFDVDVVDTTGSGDAFLGTILSGLAAGCALAASAALASAVAALAATRPGAQTSYTDAREVREFLGA